MIISLKSYARALFEVGQETDEVMAFYEAMLSFNEVMHDHDVIRVFAHGLTNPDALDGVWESLNHEYSIRFVNFLKVVQEANVILHFERLLAEYRDILNEENYISDVEIISPKDLSHQEQERVVSMLKEKYNNHLELHYEVDPSLIDGMIVKVKNDIYDTSLRSKLDRILNQGGIGK